MIFVHQTSDVPVIYLMYACCAHGQRGQSVGFVRFSPYTTVSRKLRTSVYIPQHCRFATTVIRLISVLYPSNDATEGILAA